MSDDLENLKHRLTRLELLYQVSNIIHSTLDPQQAMDLILREAVRLTNATSGSVALVNPLNGLLEIQASQGLPPEHRKFQLHVGEGITGWVVATGIPALVNDVHGDPRYVMIRPPSQSELAVPLTVEGEVRGVLNVDSDQIGAFSLHDQELLRELAVQAVKVIQNTWLYEQLRLKARMFEALARMGQTITSTLNLDEALKVIVREANSLMDSKVCALHMIDQTGQWLDLKACFGAGPSYLNKPRLAIEDSLLGGVVRRRKYTQVDNVQSSGRYQNIEVAGIEGLVSLLSMPLMFTNQAIGTLSIYKGTRYTFSNQEIGVLSALADLSAIAIEKARLYERMVDAEEQLRQNERLSALGLLAAEVAHEIRNPLTVMKMLFHSLNLEFPDSDPRSKDSRIMAEKMDQLNKIVEQILSFARNAEPKLAPVDLNQIITDLVLLTRHKCSNQGVELIKNLDPTIPPINADKNQLEQAFLNLILNAVQAMPDGGNLTITTLKWIETGSNDLAQGATIAFQDTGEGMSEAQYNRAFSSLLNSSKLQGTGLGLTIVNKVIETHRGKIEINSKSGRGTEIKIFLPK